MNNTLGYMFNFLGNLCYNLNGGLDRLNNKSRLDRLAGYFWGKAYGWYDRETAKNLHRSEWPR